MDIPELEKLCETLIKSNPRDLQKARALFRRLTSADPQALFVMSDDAAKAAISEAWFNQCAKRNELARARGPALVQLPATACVRLPTPPHSPSPQGEGAARCPLPETAHVGMPRPNNSSPAALAVSDPDHREPAGGEPHPSGGGLKTHVQTDPRRAAAPARTLTPPDLSVARAVRLHLARSIFDSFKVRDGRAIGDVRFGEIDRLASANAREAAVLRQIARSIQAPPDTLIRDAIKQADLERFVQRAAEASDAA